jgi:hypothetical protein
MATRCAGNVCSDLAPANKYFGMRAVEKARDARAVAHVHLQNNTPAAAHKGRSAACVWQQGGAWRHKSVSVSVDAVAGAPRIPLRVEGGAARHADRSERMGSDVHEQAVAPPPAAAPQLQARSLGPRFSFSFSPRPLQQPPPPPPPLTSPFPNWEGHAAAAHAGGLIPKEDAPATAFFPSHLPPLSQATG